MKQIILDGNEVVKNDFYNETGYKQFIVCMTNKATGQRALETIGKLEDFHYNNDKNRLWFELFHTVYSHVKSKKWQYVQTKIQMVEATQENWDVAEAWSHSMTVEEYKEQQKTLSELL